MARAGSDRANTQGGQFCSLWAMRRRSLLSFLLGLTVASTPLLPTVEAQSPIVRGGPSTPTADAQPIADLCFVDFGPNLEARDRLIRTGHFYGDLGRYGVVRLPVTMAQRLLGAGHDVVAIPPVQPGESLVFAVRTRSGIAPIHGRFLLSRRAFFLTAATEDQIPTSCRGSFFHGGLQVLSLRSPYVPVPEASVPVVPSLQAQGIVGGATPDPLIAQMLLEVQRSNLESHVGTLAAIQSRRANQAGFTQAVSYVTAQLSQIPRLTVTLDNFDPSFGPNVIAELPGTSLPDEVVMVGAHLDSIVNGDPNARSPGADDNASGSAAVLEIARILSQYEFERTIRFAWWSAEEFQLAGSDNYALRMASAGENIVAYVNTDMNSYRAPGDPLSMTYITNDSTVSLMNTLIQATNTYLPTLAVTTGPISGGTSDHRAFFRAGFPAAFPFEDAVQFSPFIHTPNDDVGVSANDFEQSRLITQSITAGIACLADPLPISAAEVMEFGVGCEGSLAASQDCPSLNAAGGSLSGDVLSLEYAYRVPNSAPMQLQSFSIFTQSTTGGSVTVPAFVYDGALLPNQIPIAATAITVGATPGWYSATLSPPLTLTGDFFVAIDHSAQTTVISNLTSGDTGVAYSRTPGTANSFQLSGSVTRPAFDTVCIRGPSMQLRPSIRTVGVPRVGRSFGLGLRDAVPSSPASLLFGFSDSVTSGGAALPILLPGTADCSIVVSPDVSIDVATDAEGRVDVSLQVPNLTALIGLQTYQQWVVIDLAANGFGIVTSSAVRNRIGG